MKSIRLPRTDLPRKLSVHHGKRVRLRNADAGRDFGWDETSAQATTALLAKELGELQYRLYAEGRHGVLVVLQAIDGGGKDSTIRHVFSAFNPQGCTVRAFKAPSAEELRHDYLWRIHQHVPPRGEITVFNRSYYEDVLVVRIDELVPKNVWQARYQQINDFERMLVESGIEVVKIFLHISRAEQRRRFEERIRDPRKQWKFDPQDLVKRAQWSDYAKAYDDMLRLCSTTIAPWYVIPADHKWLRDLAVTQIMVERLRALAPQFPKPKFNPRRTRVR
jgi:PPK2 family polyphosphate:nucleotide phosphotransferase